MARQIRLKAAIFESEKTQGQLAKEVGMSEPLLSMLIMGRLVPSDSEKIKISNALRKPIGALFDD